MATFNILFLLASIGAFFGSMLAFAELFYLKLNQNNRKLKKLHKLNKLRVTILNKKELEQFKPLMDKIKEDLTVEKIENERKLI